MYNVVVSGRPEGFAGPRKEVFGKIGIPQVYI